MSVWWSVGLAAGALLATWLLGRKRRSGWLVNITLNVAWLVYSISSAQWGFAVSSLIFIVMCMQSYLRWRADDVQAVDAPPTPEVVR